MNTKSWNSEICKTGNNGIEQALISQNKTRILIVSDNSTIRQELSKLINHESDLEICSEPKGDCQTQGAIEKQQVDLAIIDITSRDTNCFRIAETTKFQYPPIPVVLLSIHDKAIVRKHAMPKKTERYFSDQKATEQILKAIHYVQSLIRSQIFGFTLAVKIERNLQNDY